MRGLIGIAAVAITLTGQGVSAQTVPPAYVRTAVTNNIPPDVFFCIGQTESGRAFNGVRKPWPWTLNIAGRGAFFNSRLEAETALNQAIVQGIRNIDIGLMQINYRVHSARVNQAADLLDPYTNMAVSADILNEYRGNQDLWHAVGRYHSATPGLKQAYQGRVAKCLVNHLDQQNTASDALAVQNLLSQTDPNQAEELD